MESVYEKLKAEDLADLERYNSSSVIEEALSITLHNESEETDYGLWSEGCKQFAADNFDVLKEWVH
jgi:hypothetical protein